LSKPFMFFDVSRREQLSGQRKSLRKVLEARAAMGCKIPIFAAASSC
jgi:hypothetical protein